MFLLTSDWQASATNLDRLRMATEQMLKLCEERGVQALIHGGDVKHSLNPLDGRTLNFLAIQFEKFVQAGVRVFLLRGNHDRLGMGDQAPDFFPILRRHNQVTCLSDVFWEQVGKLRFFFLPYRNEREFLLEDMQEILKEKPDPRDSVLIFHASISGAQTHPGRQYLGDDAVALADLHPERFKHCFGGHFHLHQQVGKNVAYIGSPFCMDWGEANQKKGVLMLGPDGSSVRVVPTIVPGWYDPDLPNYSPPEMWTGAAVRLRLPVERSVVDVGAAVAARRKAAAADFPGATITVLPVDVQGEKPAVVELAPEDAEIVAAWVQDTLPEALVRRRDEVISYLVGCLEESDGVRRAQSSVELLGLHGENVLSFRNLELDFTPGLHVISGVNEDRGGSSNGSGKTSYLQALLVALFGKTPKGQAADRWKRRSALSTDPCSVELSFRLQDGRLVALRRARTPRSVSLRVAGAEVASGAGDRELQRTLEQMLGLTYDTMLSSVYLDQRELNRALVGTDAERKALFAGILNLERFARAQVVAKTALAQSVVKVQVAESALAVLDARISERAQFLVTLQSRRKSEVFALKQQIAKDAESFDTHRKRLCGLAENLRSATLAYQEADREEKEAEKVASRAEAEEYAAYVDLYRMRKTAALKTCVTCGQSLNVADLKRKVKAGQEKHERLGRETQAAKRVVGQKCRKAEAARDRFNKLRTEQATVKQALTSLEVMKRSGEEKLAALATQDVDEKRVGEELKVARADRKRRQRELESERMSGDLFRYAVSAFGKDGIPARLAATLCPRLNRAAEFYSGLFSGGEIHAQFLLADDALTVEVENLHGGETLDDQSSGESRIASLIVSFALREVIPSALDLLIADEPGEGLDEANSRMFAEGLLSLTDRYRTILVTSHNPHVLSVLSDQKQVLIRKRDGISEVAA